jgi:hypothetical protein
MTPNKYDIARQAPRSYYSSELSNGKAILCKVMYMDILHMASWPHGEKPLRINWTPRASEAHPLNPVTNIRQLYVCSPDAAFQAAIHCLVPCLDSYQTCYPQLIILLSLISSWPEKYMVGRPIFARSGTRICLGELTSYNK